MSLKTVHESSRLHSRGTSCVYLSVIKRVAPRQLHHGEAPLLLHQLMRSRARMGDSDGRPMTSSSVSKSRRFLSVFCGAIMKPHLISRDAVGKCNRKRTVNGARWCLAIVTWSHTRGYAGANTVMAANEKQPPTSMNPTKTRQAETN